MTRNDSALTAARMKVRTKRDRTHPPNDEVLRDFVRGLLSSDAEREVRSALLSSTDGEAALERIEAQVAADIPSPMVALMFDIRTIAALTAADEPAVSGLAAGDLVEDAQASQRIVVGSATVEMVVSAANELEGIVTGQGDPTARARVSLRLVAQDGESRLLGSAISDNHGKFSLGNLKFLTRPTTGSRYVVHVLKP